MNHYKISRKQAAIELLRRRKGYESLIAFSNAIDVPGKPVDQFQDDWMLRREQDTVAKHHYILLQALERTANTRHGRLMVFMPPGSAKSTYASVVAPAYFMGKWPGYRIILASYGTSLARRHGRKARQIVATPKYSSIFSGHSDNAKSVTLNSKFKAADDWALTNGSEYLARGLLSGITGNRANGAIIDDPMRGREQANSPTIRQKIWVTYVDDLLSRLLPGGWVCLVQTRWHEDDLAGRILPKNYNGESGFIKCRDGSTWEVLNLPAQCEREDDPLGRKVGEYLWPEWFDQKHWDNFKIHSATWASLYQQRPRPSEGGVFKETWCKNRYSVIPDHANVCVHSWDTAQKEKEVNDPTAGAFFRYGKKTDFYLSEVFKGRLDTPSLIRKIKNFAERDNPSAILIEDKSSGSSIIQLLKSETRLPVIAIQPEGSKLFRATDISPIVESGKLLLPESAEWLADFEGEFFGFPLSTHDDQVDAVSQFLKWSRKQVNIIECYGAGMTRTSAALTGGTTNYSNNDLNGFI